MKKRTIVFVTCMLLVAAGVSVAFFAAFPARSKPMQCQLLFGPTGDTTLTLEIKNDRLLILRDSNQPNEEYAFTDNKLPDSITIDVHDSSSSAQYTITSISRYQDVGPAPRVGLMVSVEIESDDTRYEQYCDVELKKRSETPAIAHFAGPLTVEMQTINWKIPKSTRLVTGDSPTDIRANIGTIDETTGCWTVVQTHKEDQSSFPDGVFPYVEIEFPPKVAGGPVVKATFALDKFC